MSVVIAIYYNYYLASLKFLPPTSSNLLSVLSSLYRRCPFRTICSDRRLSVTSDEEERVRN
jgi:hypothetical protein